MRLVVVLAAAALIALVAALLTGSTWPAILVVGLASVGIVLLLRDWRTERAQAAAGLPDGEDVPLFEETGDGSGSRADEFSPDISTDPDGPSSDARSDQV